MYRVYGQKFPALVFISFCLAMLVGSFLHRGDSYDMLMYVAAAKSLETSDVKAIHETTFGELKDAVAAANYESYFNNKYRKAMSESPELLAQQLPFYQIRVVFNGLVYAVHKMGFDLYLSTHIVSALSVFLSLIIFYLAFREKVIPLFWLSVPVFILLMDTFSISRFSLSDGMAMSGIALSAYFLLKEQQGKLLILLPILILVRTDLLIYVIAVVGYSMFYYRQQRLQSIMSLIAALIVYYAVNRYFGNYGWATLFYFQFFNRAPNPAEIEPVITLSAYLGVLISNLKYLFYDKQFLGYFLIIFLIILMNVRGNLKSYIENTADNRLLVLSLICLAYVLAHFILFPLLWVRFFIGQYILTFLIFLVFLSQTMHYRNEKIITVEYR